MVKKVFTRALCVFGAFFVSIYFSLWIISWLAPKNNAMILAASFDEDYARFLQLDPHAVFTKMLDDWKFRYIRISAPWNKIENEQGKYDFSSVEWYLSEAAKRNAHIVLAIGHKTPRWPECHLPGWVGDADDAKFNDALVKYVATTVNYFKNNPAIEMWQVENEPFLFFGGCRKISQSTFAKEIASVHSIDRVHPTLTSDSGELSTWFKTSQAGDYFGTTVYRTIWNKYTGYWSYTWLPPGFYIAKFWLNGRQVGQSFVTELQAEAWIPNGSALTTPLSEQIISMNVPSLEKNIDFAKRIGVARAYLWGAEWWYWMETKGDASMSAYIKAVTKN